MKCASEKERLLSTECFGDCTSKEQPEEMKKTEKSNSTKDTLGLIQGVPLFITTNAKSLLPVLLRSAPSLADISIAQFLEHPGYAREEPIQHGATHNFESLPGLRGDPVSQLRERVALRVAQIL